MHGSVDATEAMHTFCVDKVTEPENTSSPAVGETKHVSSDNNIYKVEPILTLYPEPLACSASVLNPSTVDPIP